MTEVRLRTTSHVMDFKVNEILMTFLLLKIPAYLVSKLLCISLKTLQLFLPINLETKGFKLKIVLRKNQKIFEKIGINSLQKKISASLGQKV